MKKSTITTLLIFIFLCFISCEQQENFAQQERMNQTVQEFISKNPDLNRFADRNELIKYDYGSQNYIYSKLDDNQKKLLWQSKINFVLDNVTLNTRQKLVLNQIQEELSANGLKNTEKLTSIALTAGFSDYQNKLYFQSLSSFDPKTSTMLPYNKLLLDSGSGTCYTKWCTPCDIQFNPCVGGCTQTTSGCGWWNSEPCTNRCLKD